MAQKRQNLSIHGKSHITGLKGIGVYNPNPRPKQEPTTARGKRRRAARIEKGQAG
jgi:hypothetical protein